MNKSKRVHGIPFKFSLLCTALLLTGASAVAALLPNLQMEYPTVSKELIQTFLSIPGLAQIFAVILGGMVANKFGKRNLLLAGAAIFTVGGILPMFLTNYYLILLTRMLVGVGIGIIQPISVSLIADCYKGKEQASMMGIQSAFVGAGGTLFSVIVGAVIVFNWKYAYLAYLIGAIVFFLIFFNIKDIDNLEENPDVSKESGDTDIKTPKIAYLFALFNLIFTIGSGCVFINLSLAVIESGAGNVQDGANLIVVFSVTGLIIGFLFGKIVQILKNYMGCFALILVAVPWLTIGLTTNLTIIYIMAAIGGIGFGCYMPYIVSAVNRTTTPQTSAKATSVVFTGSAVGPIVSPYIFGAIGRLAGNTASQFAFIVSAIMLGVLLIANLIFEVKTIRQKEYIENPASSI